MGMFGMAAGAVFDIAGTVINAGEAEERRKLVKEIAETPGLDFTDITQSALEGYKLNLKDATALNRAIGTANQEQLLRQEEMALPGVGKARQADLAAINRLFDDSAFTEDVMRDAAAFGMQRGGTGYAGSGSGQVSALRLSAKERMSRTQLGTGLLGSLVSSMRLANTPGVQAFIGPSLSEQLAQRSSERTQRMNILLQRAGLPTEMEVYGTHMQQIGGTLMGMGSTMGSPGGGGGSAPGGGSIYNAGGGGFGGGGGYTGGAFGGGMGGFGGLGG